ncbi:MAG: RHS repeat-associated core domain-containing protein, partial [Anaerolineae bacterium]|nr:RHS repeat-associated core domain-containing protein [Anaerolineae bacterium]
RRTVYTLAGRAIATRVTTSPPQPTDGLFYFITDHLGSTRLLATPNGSPVPGTTAHYLPYGDYRGNAPTATPLTERGYTGHHENREIGLTYMNARFYSPATGRFLTADTLIPSPANPQSHNRYSYVLGNALRYTDPTGHMACGDPSDPLCLPPPSPPPPPAPTPTPTPTPTPMLTPDPIAQQILDATVQIFVKGTDGRWYTSHGVIIDDSTLLTHNHWNFYPIDLDTADIRIYDTSGNLLYAIQGRPTITNVRSLGTGELLDVQTWHLGTPALTGRGRLPVVSSSDSNNLIGAAVYVVSWDANSSRTHVVSAQVTSYAYIESATNSPACNVTSTCPPTALRISYQTPPGSSGGAVVWQTNGQYFIVGVNAATGFATFPYPHMR